METQKYPASRDYRESLIESLKDPEDSACYLTAILEEKDPEPELFALCLGHVAAALGSDSDRQWVKDFGAKDKGQSVYELAEWLDSLGLKLTVTTKSILNRYDE